ncbi:CBO0543 family protein [Neobacillus drentensis]|uniref:CBO0543 family protein n=1 Tax=Neobacillus drentensis TaxID=220684 RepID=UPI002FFD6A8C
MKLEWWILLGAWLLTIRLLFLIPKNKIRLAVTVFLFAQAITWIFGLLVVQYGLISYPVRLFADVNRASFTYEFFVYPTVAAIFNVFYPHSSRKVLKFFYYGAYCTALTIPEVLIEKYTDSLEYHHWTWYWTWITLFLTFMITRGFCVWFYRGLLKEIDESG